MVKTRSQHAAGVSVLATSGGSAASSPRSTATARAAMAEVEAEHARRLAALAQERAVVEAERQTKLAAIQARSSAGSRASSSRSSRAFSRSEHSSPISVEKWLDTNVTVSPNIQKDICIPEVAVSVHSLPLPHVYNGTIGPVAPSSGPMMADHGLVDEARGFVSAHIGASLQPPPPPPFEGQGGDSAAATTDPVGLHNTHLHARVGTHKHVYNTNKYLEPQHSDIYLLAEAIKRLTHQPAPRRVSDLPLPTYSGTPTEWLNFQRQYERSKTYYDDVENLARISLALKGVAREAVASLLISADSPACVMSALQRQFGNPEVIVLHVVREVRALPRLNSYDSGKEINAFACRIRNSIDTIRLLNFPEHLANPELVNSILAKLTPLLKEKWVEFAFSRQNTRKCKLEILSDFLIHEAKIHLRFGILSDNFNCQKMSLMKERTEKVHTTIPKEIAYLSDKDANCALSAEPNAISLSKPTSSIIDTSKSVVSKCCYCQSQTHEIINCDNFCSLSVDHRLRWVKEKKICWRCLKKGNHSNKFCNKVCNKCKKPHHTLLHYSSTVTYNANAVPLSEVNPTDIHQLNPHTNTNLQSVSDSETVVHVAMPARECFRLLLKVIPVTVEGSKGSVDTFALLDDGSSATFIDSSVAAQIGATGLKSQVQINCVGGLAKTTVVEYVDFRIRGRRNDLPSHSLHRVRSISNLAIARQSLHVREINCDHLLGLQDVLCYEDAQPMLIIGVDNWHLTVPLEIRQGTRSQPVACRTALGWVVFGFPTSRSRPVNFIDHNVFHVQLPSESSEPQRLDLLITEHFKLDSLGVQKKEYHNFEDERAIKLLQETTRRLPSGRFETGLLWKSDSLNIPDNYSLALSRFLSLEKKLISDKTYAESYKAQIHGMLQKGYAELCTEPPQVGRVTWYLPHFGVLHPQKCKLRIVHDAAACNKGVSLNSLLLPGPDLLQPLLAILMRFREGRVALNGDIWEMFPQTKIRVEDRDAQRFLWREAPFETLREYRMSSMIFGACSSPFTALFLKNLNAEDYKETFPAAAAAIKDDHYMDDYLGSVDTVEEAAQLAANIVYVHSRACLEMKSWVSNSKEALALIPPDFCAPNITEVNLINPTATVKVLGIAWNIVEDTLGFRISASNLSETKWTKRVVLSHLMRVYDPLGLLTPIVIRGRILFQQLWRLGVGWDEKVPTEFLAKWKIWFEQLSEAAETNVPRCYFSSQRPIATQLHLFADASEHAYCCVAYWRYTFEDGTVRLALIGGKAKLAPLKPVSIPRLELQAALIAARFAQYITKAHRRKPDVTYFWSDSLTVLKWLRSDARTFRAFVAYRVGEISELTDVSSWRYVATALNVADDATRSESKFKIDRWFAGPEFLKTSPAMWPQEPSSTPVPLALDELKCRQELVALTTTYSPPESSSPVVADHSHFSKWLRLLRATARVHLCAKVFLRTLDKCLIPNPEIANSPHCLSAADIVKAEIHLLRQSQANFKEEIAYIRRSAPLPKHSRLKNFTLFIGEDGLLRLSSRIAGVREVSPCIDVQPIVLDGHHPIVRVMLAHIHQKHAHGNTELVVNEVRLRFYVLHLRPSVKSVASRCQFCRIRKAIPQVPAFGDLPQGRLAHHVRPFTNVGLDYFGPVTVTVGRRHLKRYVALFTCLTVRAIHLEVVESLSTDSALMALRRFIARRGCPTDIYSDNGTAFVGAARQLKELYDFAANQRISWHFIPPMAPFMGGCWERLVKSVKMALRVTLKERSPKEEVLQTFLLEAEATINSRPLTHVAVGVDDDEAFHFLLGGPPSDRPLQPLSDADLCRRQDYKKGLRLADHFWQRWTREVLPCLVPRRPGSHGNDPQIKCGDIVLIVDGSLPRSSWPLGRVVRTYPGRDGRVRTVDVATKGGTLKRAVRLLVRLAVDT